jgi:hypothetical protein
MGSPELAWPVLRRGGPMKLLLICASEVVCILPGATWSMTKGKVNMAIALDPVRHHLYIG